MKVFLFVFLSLSAFNLRSQTTPDCQFYVEGLVYDINTKDPLPFATISIVGKDIGVNADENGYFKISGLCDEEFNLLISFVGYKTAMHHHDSYHKLPEIYLAPDEVLLESIIVEGEANHTEQFSNNTANLSMKELAQAQSLSLGDAISKLSGISTLSTGQNIVKPMIHGLHSSRILIINNGIRHEFQNWGSEHAPEIDPGQAGSLEVVKGAATVRYGPNALGGVILVNPPKLESNTALKGDFSVTGKSNGKSLTTNFRLQKGFDRLSMAGNVNYTKQGDLHAPDYNLSNTGKEESSYAGRINYHFNHLDLESFYSRVDQNLGILRGSVTGNLEDLALAIGSREPLYSQSFKYDINNPRQETVHELAKFKANYLWGSQIITATYGFQKNQRKEFDVRRGANNERPSIDLQLFTHSLDLDWHHSNWQGIDGLIGIQSLYQDNNNLPGTNTVGFVPNFNISRIGFFVMESTDKGNYTLEAGGRFDYQYLSVRGRAQNNDIFRDKLSYKNASATVGIVHEPNSKYTLRSNIGTAWRPPNVSELYSYGKHQASIEYGMWRYEIDEAGNVSTKQVLNGEQKTIHAESGLKWINSININLEKFQFEAVGYLNYIRNYIYSKPAGIISTVRGSFPFYIYDQENAMFMGIDVSIWKQHSEKFESKIRASYLRAKNMGNHDNFVEIPPINFNYTIDWKIIETKLTQLSFEVTSDYVFKQFDAPGVINIEAFLDTDNEINLNGRSFDLLPATQGFLMIGSGINFTKNKMDINLEAKNLLNNSYRIYTDRLRYFSDQPGINFSINISYHL